MLTTSEEPTSLSSMKAEEGRRDLARLMMILVGLFLAYWLVLIISVFFEDDENSARDISQSVAAQLVSHT